MKVIPLCSFIIRLSQLCNGQRNNQTARVKNVFCNVSEKFVYKNFSCFAKPYSRTLSTFSTNFLFKKPVDPFLIDMRLDYKYGIVFREIVKLPYSINFCDMPKVRKLNKLFSEFAEFIESSAPGVFHDCPYKDLIIRNRTLRVDALMNFWPSGEYRMRFYLNTKSGEKIFELKIAGIFNSPIKETFG